MYKGRKLLAKIMLLARAQRMPYVEDNVEGGGFHAKTQRAQSVEDTVEGEDFTPRREHKA